VFEGGGLVLFKKARNNYHLNGYRQQKIGEVGKEMTRGQENLKGAVKTYITGIRQTCLPMRERTER